MTNGVNHCEGAAPRIMAARSTPLQTREIVVRHQRNSDHRPLAPRSPLAQPFLRRRSGLSWQGPQRRARARCDLKFAHPISDWPIANITWDRKESLTVSRALELALFRDAKLDVSKVPAK